MKELVSHLTAPTPVSAPIPGREAAMQRNADGRGYAFTLDRWARLRRFLILGSAGGTYYASERKLTVENAAVVRECLAEDAVKTVAEISRVSLGGLAKQQEPTLLALALCCAADPATPQGVVARRCAEAALTRIVRTGTMLFQFLTAVTALRGWSSGLRRAVGRWYDEKRGGDDGQWEPLAYQLIKYRQRDGWTHRDAVRLSHPKRLPRDLARWMTGKSHDAAALPKQIRGYEQLRGADNALGAALLVTEYDLPWEAVPTELHGEPAVWAALLPTMPPQALIRNLGRLTNLGLLAPGGQMVGTVRARLLATDAIRRARVHPFAIWVALKTYAAGAGLRSSWTPNPAITDLLNAVFVAALDTLPPLNQRLALVLDGSASMNTAVLGGLCSAAEATAVMAYTLHRQAPESLVFGFSSEAWLIPNASPGQRLDDYVQAVLARRLATNTDLSCVVPLLEAMAQFRPDALIAMTDGEMNGGWQPSQAVVRYRGARRMPTVVVATTASATSLADPQDAQWFNAVGCDASLPEVIGTILRGEVA